MWRTTHSMLFNWVMWRLSAALDAQSTYTGVYANGGPTNVDGPSDLSELCDRSPADNRGVKM